MATILLATSLCIPAAQAFEFTSSSNISSGSSSLSTSADHAITELQLKSILGSQNIPGAQVVHRKGSFTESYAIGTARLDLETPVSENTMFQAASLTKVVSSYAFLKRVDSGELDLDTPLWNYYQSPRIANNSEAQMITARMVLNHTTGLPNWAGTPGDANSELTPQWTPGTKYGYSGDAFFLLQQVVEHLENKDFADILRDEVFTPFGMSHSSLVFRDEDVPLMTVGHDENGVPGKLSEYRHGNDAYTLLTTGLDYTSFIQRAIVDGEGLSKKIHEEWLSPSSDANQTPPSPADPYISWGLGVGLEESNLGPAVWHWGDNGTRRAFFITFPERDESVTMFWNSSNGQKSAAATLKLFLGNTDFHSIEWVDGNPE
ncbi:serine hydrolase domain-containing protein [Corynebacterium pacaense]|uniref:serine hydrolase domain-containing protein n=1 Tax=Corynebacterium pacaense TaxID=1816684 RepID=UPI0009BB8ECD|nr:serine hydrolase domain-containing protein [Corynebacterium pacaense]